MGVDVAWEDANGDVLENLVDDGNYVAKLMAYMPIGGSHCLAYIDEYGGTTFNRLQVPRLLEELDEIPTDALDARTREFLERLRGLAERCIREVHTYLKFSGD
jgi:hypothetical protein